ncbi:GntR family transcriptional regulator [Caulobacter sp. CCUG 60055]|uniref:GntR family transcriptional regulator n=1 Tax=Caulobacter sp. CCUG 60055 TaxID=2100090 RepID=UPI002418A790|nr:FCD domain-containing protein [Caulobacter sp. CCUG 60055]MCI3181673.1 GntR family transcriptional regulator [Caulobacter sp. CCUG 60055]
MNVSEQRLRGGKTSASSLIDQTQQRIRRDIVRGVLPAGGRLKIEELARRYGVGLSPIREALSLLCATRLVAKEDRRGFRVTPVSLANYMDVRAVMNRLWPMALHMALTNGDEAWEKRLVLALYRTLKFDWAKAEQQPELYDEWDAAFRDFHREMVAGAGSPTLSDFIDGLVDQLERYRWLAPEVRADTSFDDRNHKALVDALHQRDPARLNEAMTTYASGGNAHREAVEAKLKAL